MSQDAIEITWRQHSEPRLDHVSDHVPMASTETRLRRALVRILSAAEGRPGFQPMNWSDVAEVARQALQTSVHAQRP
ncbi:MAG: hypothetical protein AAFV45_04370 [Pseudomonadota bacterium]